MTVNTITDTVFDQMKKPMGAMPGADEWEKAAKSWIEAMPEGMRPAAAMMAPSMAAAAAMSAAGMAAAGQAAGAWFNLMGVMLDTTKDGKVSPSDLAGLFGWAGVDGHPAPAAGVPEKPAAKKPVRKQASAKAQKATGTVAVSGIDTPAMPSAAPADPLSREHVDAPAAMTLAAETFVADAAHVVSDAMDVTGKAVQGMMDDAREAASVASYTAVSAITALMPEDFVKPAGLDKPGTRDDLKLISGVGPKLEQVLNGLGIWTFDQISKWTGAEIAWVDDYLQFSGRIGRDNWIGQAAALAKGGVDEYAKVFGKQPK